MLTVTSRVSSAFKSQLERLLFFNDQQSRFRHRIVASIESYGLPQIEESGGLLRIRLSGRHDAQSLFMTATAEGDRPVGAVAYVRDRPERFVVTHVAVDPSYSSAAAGADRLVLMRLLYAVKAAAQVTAGVQQVDFYYLEGRLRTMPLHKRHGQ